MSSTQALQVFKFEKNEIRTVMHNDEPWWVAIDVCNVLELSNVSMAVNGNEKTGDLGLDNDEKLVLGILISGQIRSVICVNEPGLYALIRKSRKPQAKSFDRWIRHEVLPSIRKTGSYSVHQDTPTSSSPSLQGWDPAFQSEEEIKRELRYNKAKAQFLEEHLLYHYPQKQQKTQSKLSTQLTQPALPSSDKPVPTPEYIQSEILRHLDRLSARGETSASATHLRDYMPQFTRMQIEIECCAMVQQGALQEIRTAHAIKYERVGKDGLHLT